MTRPNAVSFARARLTRMATRFEIIVSLVLSVGALGCQSATDAPTSTRPILTTTSSQPVPTTSTSSAGSTTTTTASTTTTSAAADIGNLTLTLKEVASGFDVPVQLVADPDGGSDLVVEQSGRIVGLDDRSVALDLTDDVVYGGEQGLLGLAFHPDFVQNRLAYVNYVGNGPRTVIEQFTVAADGRFDVSSRTIILEVPQPASNHNGGMIAFGPDGYLWIGMGDGGGSADRYGNGQRPDTLLGAMLRIAVGVEGVATYAIPPDNPYATGGDGAPEVWSIGLRNPWRFSFDGETVWIADVGQGSIEEVDAAPASQAGVNYGWPVMEGSQCFLSSTCDPSPYVAPVTEYDHSQGCSITGGYVYRGAAIPALAGSYVYSDYCAGFLRTWSPDTGDVDWTPQVGATPSVTGFGVGGDGELYVVSQSGRILRLEAAG